MGERGLGADSSKQEVEDLYKRLNYDTKYWNTFYSFLSGASDSLDEYITNLMKVNEE
jgi:hypothetical protein